MMKMKINVAMELVLKHVPIWDAVVMLIHGTVSLGTWVCLQPARHVICCAAAQRGGTKAAGSRTKGWEGSWEDLTGFRDCFFSI